MLKEDSQNPKIWIKIDQDSKDLRESVQSAKESEDSGLCC